MLNCSNTKKKKNQNKTHAYKTLKTAGVQIIMLKHPTKHQKLLLLLLLLLLVLLLLFSNGHRLSQIACLEREREEGGERRKEGRERNRERGRGASHLPFGQSVFKVLT